MTELYDDPSIVGKKMVVIRWNPHGYTVPSNYRLQTRQERLATMVAMKRAVRRCPPPDPITVIYMYYSRDNDHISCRLPSVLVYSMEDVEQCEMRWVGTIDK